MSDLAMIIINLALSLVGAGVGAYVGLRVGLTRLQEQLKFTNERLADLGDRIIRLEGVYFGKELR